MGGAAGLLARIHKIKGAGMNTKTLPAEIISALKTVLGMRGFVGEERRIERRKARATLRNFLDTVKPLHASDCAVHNAPAYPAGPCDCGVDTIQEINDEP